jgi:hypothetical protein
VVLEIELFRQTPLQDILEKVEDNMEYDSSQVLLDYNILVFGSLEVVVELIEHFVEMMKRMHDVIRDYFHYDMMCWMLFDMVMGTMG